MDTVSEQKKYIKPLVFILGCLAGLLFFRISFGFTIVNPQYDGWVLATGGDLSQHYTGWRYFRKTPWTFPLGLTDGLSSDGMISCMYTDSIPLLAVFFKILSPVLPETFQYIGIWELICYILMGGTSALLVNKFSRNPFYCVICSVFYIMAPTVMSRVLHHEALSAQWILILAIMLWTDAGRDWRFRATPVVLWSLLGVLCVTVHVYFLGMIFMIMAGYILTDIFRKKRIIHSVAVAGFTLLSSVITMFVFGAFYGDSGYTAAGLGNYSANYNALLNSYGHSDFIDAMAVYNQNSEGFGYLGLGMIVMAVPGLIFGIISFWWNEDGFKATFTGRISSCWFPVLTALIVIAMSVFFAASPVGTFNDRIIYEIHYPGIIEKFLMVFRASGRFIWITDYIVFTGIIAAAASLNKKAFIIPAAVICLGIQLADMRSWITSFHTKYSVTDTVFDSPLKSEKWDEITEGRDTFIFTPLSLSAVSGYSAYKGFSEYAADHDMKLSSYYFARTNYETLSAYAQNCLDDLSSGNGMKNAVYIILDPESAPSQKYAEVLEIDGYTVALSK